MREEWKNLWIQWVNHLWMMPFGLLIAFIFFLIAVPQWHRSGMLKTGVMVLSIYGLVIPVVVSLCFGAAYAARLYISLKIGRTIKFSLPHNILINFVGLVIGLRIGMWITHTTLGTTATGENFLSSLVFGGGVIAIFSFYFAYKQAKEESLALRAEAAEARYHALEARMRPHFLFNALNSLAELIESGQGNAAQTTYKLSDLYRRILANSGLKTAALDSEVEIVRSYLELEQLRFGSRLNFSIRTPENSHEIYLPSLALQTLVENAVKHGVAPSVEGGHIDLEISGWDVNTPLDKKPAIRTPDSSEYAEARKKLYTLRVTNTGNRFQDEARNSGTGLTNTRARLDLLYGNRHEFKIEADHQGRTVASFYFTGEKID